MSEEQQVQVVGQIVIAITTEGQIVWEIQPQDCKLPIRVFVDAIWRVWLDLFTKALTGEVIAAITTPGKLFGAGGEKLL